MNHRFTITAPHNAVVGRRLIGRQLQRDTHCQPPVRLATAITQHSEQQLSSCAIHQRFPPVLPLNAAPDVQVVLGPDAMQPPSCAGTHREILNPTNGNGIILVGKLPPPDKMCENAANSGERINGLRSVEPLADAHGVRNRVLRDGPASVIACMFVQVECGSVKLKTGQSKRGEQCGT